MHLPFVWQAWRLMTPTFVLCGRRGTYGIQLALVTRLVPADAASFLCGRRGTYGAQLALVTRLVPADAASFCVAGVALGDMHLRFVWQAWHWVTSASTLCGRRGTYGSQLALVTRLVARGTNGSQLALVTRLVAFGAASFCVAGVALGDMHLRLVWQAWHLVTSTSTLCGRRGTYGIQLALVMRLVPADAASFCVAGVALGDIHVRFVWQAWHLWHSAGSGDALGRVWRRLILRGRRGAW
eukprot:s7_g58.t1